VGSATPDVERTPPTRADHRTVSSLWWAAALLLGLAAGNFLFRLGSSSLFVDEAFSWTVASAPIRDLYAQVKLSEVAPPGYYAGLHAWMTVGGSESEGWMRALSAVGGLGVVAAVIWLADMVGGRRAAIGAGLLAALSPLVLRYSQEARAYIFVMLAVTLAAGASVKAIQASDTRAERRWALAATAASVAAVWLHYTALLIIVPLGVWLFRHPGLTRQLKVIYLVSVGVAQLAVTPLMLHQLSGDNPGAARYARLTRDNALDVLGTPFDGRYPNNRGVVLVGGVAAILAVIALWQGRVRVRQGRLIAALALAPILAVAVITALSTDVLLSRYTAVAAPFVLVAIASAAMAAGRRLAVVGLGLLVVIAALASASSHRTVSNHPAIGKAFAAAGSQWRAGDAMLVAPRYHFDLISAPLTNYYTEESLPPRTRIIAEPSPALLRQLSRQRRRLWIVGDSPASRRANDAFVRPLGYRLAGLRSYPGVVKLQLLLLEPAMQ